MPMLVWKSSDALKQIFASVMSGTEFTDPYGFDESNKTTPHLDFVKDQGVYLMSGNIAERRNWVAYAKGCNPEIDDDFYDASRYACGGDDFVECLPIDEDLAEEIARGGSFWLEIDGDSLAYGFC